MATILSVASASNYYRILRLSMICKDLRKGRISSCCSIPLQKHRLTGRISQRRLQLLPHLFCMDEAGADPSLANQFSDGGASSGGSPCGHSSREPEEEFKSQTVGGDVKEQGKKLVAEDASTMNLMSPLYHSSIFQWHHFPRRFGEGILVTGVLFTVLISTVVIVDSHIWGVIRKPLAPFFLTRPFCMSAVISSCLGFFFVPLLDWVKAHQVFRTEGPKDHFTKAGTATMGGLFFIPVGIGVARFATGKSVELWGVCATTLAFATIGLLDDGLTIWRKHNYGMPGWFKFLLQVAVGSAFVFWLNGASLSSPYKMKCLVPLLPPFGLWYLGNWYLPLTAFCFAAMSNGVNLTDGLDGLAAGTSAATYIGMAVAVLPIYPDLGIFGASMAGACIGFLVHNRYKATVFMGDTGSLALGGGLAAMAACSGMFFPLFIASGIFVIETVSVIAQVSYFKLTKRLEGKGRRLLRMSPFHHHLELLGWTEPTIAAAAYIVAYILASLAAYIGLISA